MDVKTFQDALNYETDDYACRLWGKHGQTRSYITIKGSSPIYSIVRELYAFGGKIYVDCTKKQVIVDCKMHNINDVDMQIVRDYVNVIASPMYDMLSRVQPRSKGFHR